MFGNNRPGFGSSSNAFGAASSPFGSQSLQQSAPAFGANQQSNTQAGFGGFGAAATGTPGNTGTSMFGTSNATTPANSFGQTTAGGIGSTNNANRTSMFGGSTLMAPAGPSAVGGGNTGTMIKQYAPFPEKDPTTGVMNSFQSITCMPEYRNSSFEELRLQDYQAGHRYPSANASAGSQFGGQQAATSTGFGMMNNTNTPTSAGGLFGQQNATQNSPFGSVASTTSNTSNALGNTFGGNTLTNINASNNSPFGMNKPASGGLFGNNQASGTTGMFGQQNNSAGGTFGQQTNSFGTNSAGSTGMFGQTNNQTGGAFGNQQNNSFGNTSQQASGGLFGQSANNTSSSPFGQQPNQTSGGLFGAKSATSGGLFGQSNNTFGSNTTNTSGGVFGQNNQPTQQTGGLFGQNNQQQGAAGLFGQNNTNQQQGSGGLFGQQSTNNAFGQTQPTGTNTGLFGSKPPGGLFGQAQPSTGFGANAGTTTSGGLFGQNNQQQSSGMFGQNNQQQPQQAGGMFGQNNAQQPQQAGGMFGQNNAQQPQQAGGMFGQNNQQQQSAGGLFGGKPAGTTTGLFGGNQPAQSGGLFGANTQQPQQQGGGLFGSQQQQPSGGLFSAKPAGTSGGGLFGNSSATGQTSTTSGGLFGAKPVGTTGGGLFGNNTATSSAGGLGANTMGNNNIASTSGGLFGAKPAGTTGGGLFGNNNSTGPTGTSTGLFGAKPSGTTSSNFGGGMFGANNTANTTGNSLGGGLFGNKSQQPMPSMQGGNQQQLQSNNPYGTNDLFTRIAIPDPIVKPTQPSVTKINAEQKKSSSLTSAYRLDPKPLFTKNPLELTRCIESSPMSSVSSTPDSLGKELVPISSSSSLFSPESDVAILTADKLLFNPDRKSLKNLIINKKKMEESMKTSSYDEDSAPVQRISFSISNNAKVDKDIKPSEEPSLFEQVQETPVASKESKKKQSNSAPSFTFSEPKFTVPTKTPAETKTKSSSNVNNDTCFVDDKYYISPSLDTLASKSILQLRKVSGLVIGHKDYGKIEFLEPTDLSNINLTSLCGTIIVFEPRSCFINAVGNATTNEGEGINVRARISVYKCYPIDKSTRKPITDASHPLVKRHIERLKKLPSVKFESYDPISGTFVFTVDHPVA